jgi:hypothetical protein
LISWMQNSTEINHFAINQIRRIILLNKEQVTALFHFVVLKIQTIRCNGKEKIRVIIGSINEYNEWNKQLMIPESVKSFV